MVLLIAGLALTACKSTIPASDNINSPAPVPPGPVRGTVINSDSFVTVKIMNITAASAGYPWTLEVLVQNTTDVNNLPNPVKDSVGKVVTVVTDQDMTYFKVNNVVPAEIKLIGDVNTPGGIRLYLYNIGPK